MAVITPSALITDIRGKLGRSMVFGNWKGKSWVRTPSTSTPNPASDLQRPIRRAITKLVHKWKVELTELQKNGWDALAADLTSAGGQYSAQTSALRNGFPKMAADDMSVESGVNLFVAVNLGRIQAVVPSGALLQDPAAQVLPVVRVVEDAPPSVLLFDPEAPVAFTANWDNVLAQLDMAWSMPSDPAIDIPAADLINSEQAWTEVYLRLGDPRVNRLASVTGNTWGAAVSNSQTGYWVPGGTTGARAPFRIGGRYRVAARTRTCYGRVSPWSDAVLWTATGP